MKKQAWWHFFIGKKELADILSQFGVFDMDTLVCMTDDEFRNFIDDKTAAFLKKAGLTEDQKIHFYWMRAVLGLYRQELQEKMLKAELTLSANYFGVRNPKKLENMSVEKLKKVFEAKHQSITKMNVPDSDKNDFISELESKKFYTMYYILSLGLQKAKNRNSKIYDSARHSWLMNASGAVFLPCYIFMSKHPEISVCLTVLAAMGGLMLRDELLQNKQYKSIDKLSEICVMLKKQMEKQK